MAGTHKCPGPKCALRCPNDKLACRAHWFQVPSTVRDSVYETWNHGRGAGSEEHTHAIEAAISHMTEIPAKR